MNSEFEAPGYVPNDEAASDDRCMSVARGITCIVTIHGVGFQQFPWDGRPGYADGLHRRLNAQLGSLLSDDPKRARERSAPGEAGPIYVASHWPPESERTEPALRRLGVRDSIDPSRIVTSGEGWDAPLGDRKGRIAHVALVYSHLIDKGIDWRSLFEMNAQAMCSLPRYASIGGLARMAASDLRALWAHRHDQSPAPKPGLQVRDDMDGRSVAARNFRHPLDNGTPDGLAKVLTQVADDVGAYVCRNDFRERVRAFVCDALLRVCLRDDVESVIVNSHSNGTVIAFDVLRELPLECARKVRGFVTAGSPLRKYTQLWSWGYEAASIGAIEGRWQNFWDDHDPVADPLGPPDDWRRGDEYFIDPQRALFHSTDADSGEVSPIVISDVKVDNLVHSEPGSLRAHDYWDNDSEFVAPLAQLLRDVTTARRPRRMSA